MGQLITRLKGAISKVPILIRCSQRAAFSDFFESSNNEVCLDLGCGDGWITHNQPMLQSGGLYYLDHGIPGHTYFNLKHFCCCDIHKTPVADQTVDTIIMSSVLQVVPEPDALMAEIKRILKPSGTLILSVPEGYPLIKRFLSLSWIRSYLSSIHPGKGSYSQLLRDTNDLYRIEGPGFFGQEELSTLLEQFGFSICKEQQSPKFFVSTAFQLLLLARYLLNQKRLTSRLDILLVPLVFLDKLIPISKNPIERVYKASLTS